MKGFFKISGIYFDTKPTKGSNNAVTSGSVFEAIEEGSISYDDTELRNRMTQAESDIDSLETDVSSKASSVDLTALGGRVTQAESDIDSLETDVSSKASSADLTALGGRVTQAESDIDSLEMDVSEINNIIKPNDTHPTIYRNYTNVSTNTLFDSEGVLTKTPTELIVALKNKGLITSTTGYTQIHSCINFVNSNANRVVISDGTHNINLVNGWIEFEGAYLSGTSAYGSEERWIMKLFDVANCQMSIITKRANAEPIMKTVILQ